MPDAAERTRSYGRVMDGMLGAIGNTPAVRLIHLVEPDMAEVWVKLEAANPTGSYKDRMALAMIEGAERSGRLAPGQTRRRVHRREHGQLACFRLRGEELPVAHRHVRRVRGREAPDDGGVRRALGGVASPEGITPDLMVTCDRALVLAGEIGGYQTDQFTNTDMIDGYRRLGTELLEQVPSPIDALCLYIGTAGCFARREPRRCAPRIQTSNVSRSSQPSRPCYRAARQARIASRGAAWASAPIYSVPTTSTR